MLLLLCLCVTMFVTGCGQGQKIEEIEEDITISEPANDEIKFGNDGINAGIAGDSDGVEIVSSGKDSYQNMIAMSLEDVGRSDPFVPTSEQVVIKPKSDINYNLLPPPESLLTDEKAKDVIATKVSGIMYDPNNPSAILNISNNDYLVKTGDDINGYRVLAIARNYVTVQYGANVYKAGVGELLSTNDIKFNTISNLENKFGGNKTKK